MGRASKTFIASAAIAAGLAGAAHAQEAANPNVVVTAERTPATTLAETPDAYVITSDDIQAVQAIFAADVLTMAPGVSLSATGPFGGVTGVSIRGATADKTLVLVDGVPVNDASQPEGGFDFGPLDLGDVAKIEVLTGPQGALWGSDAIGGVIAITTAEPKGVSLEAEGGSLDTWRGVAQAGVSTPTWALGVSAAGFSTAGVSAADTRNNYARFGLPGLRNIEPDADAETTLDVRGRWTPSDAVSLDAQVRWNHARTDIDGFPPPLFVLADTNDVQVSDSVEAFARARIRGPWGLQNELSVSSYDLERGDHGESGAFGFDARRQVYRWTVAKGAESDPLSAVVGVERENTTANLSSGARFDLGATSAFALARARPLAGLSVLAGVRYDAPDRFRAQTTVRLGATYALPAGFSLQASFDQGFKTPTISETACDFCFAPRVALRPEHAQGYDGGVGWRSPDGRVFARAVAYALDVTDEIAFVDGRYINIARARSRGVEVEGEAALGWGFRLRGTYSYTDAIDATTHVNLRRVPLNSGSAEMFWKHGKLDAALSVRTEGVDLDTDLDGFTPVVRPGFVVADLAGGYALNSHVRLTARISNLADARYEQAFGFGAAGRTFLLGLRLND
ncbi:MAG TPA: TonB-dependent receptor [Caulobacteraceae bacterium]|nr:TonB-dependent receptor [Caulobacteraceae bacterium]